MPPRVLTETTSTVSDETVSVREPDRLAAPPSLQRCHMQMGFGNPNYEIARTSH
jgi:hypothetical protein